MIKTTETRINKISNGKYFIILEIYENNTFKILNHLGYEEFIFRNKEVTKIVLQLLEEAYLIINEEVYYTLTENR